MPNLSAWAFWGLHPGSPLALAENSEVTPCLLPCLTEEALVGKDLVGRFADLIQRGAFQLHLESSTFPADTSIRFPQGDGFGTSPRTRLGCLEGFHPVSATSNANQDLLGCGRSTLSGDRC